ncbi:MAG TPA: hypothetical protein VII06_29835 [Chloroflexota bacterium]
MATRFGPLAAVGCLALLLAPIGASLSSAAGPLAQFPPTGLPPCGGSVPFPPDVRLREPAPGLPPESVALLGVWEGQLAEGANPSAGVASTIQIGAAVRLAVEEVTADRARIVLGYGALPTTSGSWSARVVPTNAGRLELGTNPLMVFTLSSDRQTLSGTIDRAGGRIGARLTRCTMGETIVERPTSAPAVRPAATATPLPPPTPGADNPPGPPSRPPGPVLYQDDFTDSTSGWPRQSNNPEAALAGYDDGEYQVIRPARTSGANWFSRTREGFTDVQIEVDARLVAPTEGSYLFLGFRRQENGEHYGFEVDPDDGTYRLVRHVPNAASQTVIGRTRAPAIQGGTATNHLTVLVQGADVVLSINRREVGRAHDDQFAQGSLVLGVGNRGQGPTEGRFANLVVTSVE